VTPSKMGVGQVAFFAAFAIFSYGLYVNLSKPVETYVMEENGYFGKGSPKPDDQSIKPFKVSVPDEELKVLKDRLKSARIGHEQLEDVPDFRYGFNLKTLRQYQDYWLNKYDWRKHEATLNSFTQFTTQIEGLNVHFLHVKPANKYKKVVPLLLAHGWPGNVFEFYKIIPMLTDPEKHGFGNDIAFEVIAPSIPGYGWSEAAHKTGLNTATTARIFNKLMTQRLKFKKYIAQGGDWGSSIVSNIGRFFPQNVYGIHLNMIIAGLDKPTSFLRLIIGSYFPSIAFSNPQHAGYSLKDELVQFIKESGYFHIQATKPDTVGVSLNDSPLGLLAYIGEKFSTWTNKLHTSLEDGGIERKFTKDEIITIVMIYWLNQNIISSQRFYREHFADHLVRDVTKIFVTVPTGYSAFANDLISPTPVEIARNYYNITHYNSFGDGGHFAAFEMPKYLAKDIFAFAKKIQ